jgi:hypothetical protein
MNIGGVKIGGEFGSTSANSSGTSSATTTGTGTSKKVLSQAAIDKLIYDVLSADSGLASLATGENLSGGYGSSSKAILAQDFVTKLVGELANVTAETVTTSNQQQDTESTSSTKQKKSGLKTVICTYLYSLNLFPGELYNHEIAIKHLESLDPAIIRGYHFWAVPFVRLLKRSPFLSSTLIPLLLPLCISRYKQVITGKKTIGGFLTITLGHPICAMIGSMVQGKEIPDGNRS